MKILYIFVLRTKNRYHYRKKGINFLCVIRIEKIQNLQTSQGYIFHILQHFTTKLCNFTKFKMLFNAVIMNFTISKFFKISSFMQLVQVLNSFEIEKEAGFLDRL